MLRFLNGNASAVQAIGAILTAAVTVVLVVITARYVHLTGRLAKAAEAQLTYLAAADEGRRRQVLTTIRMLQLLLAALPRDMPQAESMRKAVMWTSDDLTDLQNNSALLGRSQGQLAATVGPPMRRIADLVASVKRVDPAYGFRWSEFDWNGWESGIVSAVKGLEELRVAVDRNSDE